MQKLSKNEVLMLNIGSMCTGARVIAVSFLLQVDVCCQCCTGAGLGHMAHRWQGRRNKDLVYYPGHMRSGSCRCMRRSCKATSL